MNNVEMKKWKCIEMNEYINKWIIKKYIIKKKNNVK